MLTSLVTEEPFKILFLIAKHTSYGKDTFIIATHT